MHIHVGANVPGYLPESDVSCTDDLSSAVEALRHDLKDLQEHYFEQCEAKTPERQEKGSECCAWCDVAYDVEAALSAIADGDVRHYLTRPDGFEPVAWSAAFNPPEGPDVVHWAVKLDLDGETCEVRELQD